MNIYGTDTVKLWIPAERLKELQRVAEQLTAAYERQREEYEREQIATAQSEQQWEEACKKSQQR